jgi:NDP-sugar pyrophosphorylase family protein
MKAMLLAAGVGSRLDPLTRRLPKPMVPVMNRPAMEHILELLVHHGFTEIMVNLHYMGDVIESHFGDGSRWGARITYSREDQLWGDAGSVGRVKDFWDDTFLVIGADDVTDMDLGALVAYHKDRRADATIALYPVEDPSEYGVAVVEKGRIIGFQEKPSPSQAKSRMANTGVYVFEPRVLDMVPEGKVYGLGRDLLPGLLDEGRPFFGWQADGYWCDIGSLAYYHQTHRDALAGRIALTSGLSELLPRVWVAESVELHPDAVVVGPCLLGGGCRIGAGAKIERSVLGPNCSVAEGSLINDCVIWGSVSVGPATTLQSCLVGSGCAVSSTGELHRAIIV